MSYALAAPWWSRSATPGGGWLLLLGEGESRQGPSGTDMLTSAFAESTRAPRPAAAAYPDPLMTDACLPLEASGRCGWRES